MAASVAKQSVKQQLLRLSEQWPKDVVRPTRQLKDTIAQLADARPAWSNAPSTSAAAAGGADIKEGQVIVNSLQNLLNSKAFKQYPLSERTRKPPSMPKHYSNLMDGLRKVERGEKEPWYKSFFRFRK